MSKKFLIAALSIVAMAGCLIGTWAAKFLLVLALADSFDTTQKFKTQMVGEFTDNDAEEAYLFVTLNSGISFPNGTIAEMHDDGWDTFHCCFTLPSKNYPAFVQSFSLSPVTPEDRTFAFPGLPMGTQVIPKSAFRMESTAIQYRTTMIADGSTNKIWLTLRSSPPCD